MGIMVESGNSNVNRSFNRNFIRNHPQFFKNFAGENDGVSFNGTFFHPTGYEKYYHYDQEYHEEPNRKMRSKIAVETAISPAKNYG